MKHSINFKIHVKYTFRFLGDFFFLFLILNNPLKSNEIAIIGIFLVKRYLSEIFKELILYVSFFTAIRFLFLFDTARNFSIVTFSCLLIIYI